jgi:hypothetical protein
MAELVVARVNAVDDADHELGGGGPVKGPAVGLHHVTTNGTVR